MKKAVTIFSIISLMTYQLSFAQDQSRIEFPSAGVNSIAGQTGISPDLWPGTIVIKFREGVSIPSVTQSPVITGIITIDERLINIEASSLVKRFRHKPIPAGSGLPDLSRIYRLNFPEKFNPIEVATLFKEDPNVEYAEPEPIMKILDVPNDPMYPQQQHLPQIMAEQAWNIHKGENGAEEVKIAFIDTGVDWTHPDLTANTWENLGEDADGDGHTLQTIGSVTVLDPGDLNGIDDDGNGFVDDLIGWDFYDEYINGNGSNPNPNPICSVGFHGTHCAGIATAVTGNGIGVAGISWNVKYMPVQVDRNNNLEWGWDGIIYAADMGADVISCSWGGYYWAYNQFGAEVLAYARAKGSIVVCAAGNENIDGHLMPASYPGAISVASVNVDDTKAPYSTYGAAMDVSAPGGGLDGGILSTLPDNSYGTEMGTSMATPLVAGLMGLVKSYHPDWSSEQVIGQVIATCDNIDSLNPLYEKKLGSGRINAFKALAMTGVVPPQELKLEMLDYTISDANNNGKLEPGETGTISLRIRNYTHCVATGAVSFTLSTDDEQIEITGNNYVGTIDSDSIFVFENIVQFMVLPGATSHAALLTLTIAGDVPVVMGNELTIPVVVAPSGFFVYEKYENGRDYSGTFIRNYLERRGFEVTYSNDFPQSLLGFECVFLSLGNLVEPNWDPGTFVTEEMGLVITDYLKQGGKIYVEGGSIFYMAQECNYGTLIYLKNLFGVSGVTVAYKNPLDKLSGINGTPLEGMEFTSSSQYNNYYIERINSYSTATCMLQESNHGKVGIYNTGPTYGQKTFYFTYSLADLKDVDKTSNRYNLLNKIMEVLGYPMPPGYLIANFTAEKFAAGISEEITFTDISLAPSYVNIVSWQWDFQNDGIIDSYDQNPVFAYNEAGSYDVRLVVSNGGNVDEFVQENFITIHRGMLVYEGIENCQDMSGTWIKDFLEQNYYLVTYTTEVPRSLSGYEAVFLSFGTPMSFSVVLEDGFVRIIRDYLQEGGNVYLEEGFTFALDQPNPSVWQMFGIQNVTNPFTTFTTIPFDTIVGGLGSVCEGFSFENTNQVGQFFIDQYTPNAEGIVAFEEPGYGNVAIQHEGANGEKTFCFSWALAELQDGETTREDLMHAILGYFNLLTGLNKRLESKDNIAIQVYPNPFTASTTLEYELKETALVNLTMYNHLGQQNACLINETRGAGRHQTQWNAENLPAGIYYYRLQADSQLKTGKLILLK